MSESGQPGAATPGEHGDGTGQQDDLTRSGSGWAPPATGWSGGADAPAYRDTAAPWHRPDPATGWDASSPRHGDLPAPLTDPDPDPEPRNGRAHLNGVSHPGEEPPRGRPSPMSAPPADAPRFGADLRRDADGGRLVVPAQRPAPPTEQQHGPADPDAVGWHSAEEPPRASRWAEGGFPTSAPPAVQVPPVGTAASGFEVPPGFHAPQADRGQADRAEADPFPPDTPGAWTDRFHPGSPSESAGARGGDEAGARGAPDRRAEDAPHAAEQPFAGPGHRPADEPDWSGPSWNRPSWGGGWAPPWAREDEPPPGRRSRSDRTTEWPAEPARPYEPVRAEPARPYEPVRAEPARPYEPVRSEVPGPYELTRAEREASTRPTDRPVPERSAVDESVAWTGGRSAAAPSPVAPSSAPPATAPSSAPPATASSGAPPAAAPPVLTEEPAADTTPTTDRADRPFRLRSVPVETAPTELPGHPPAAAGSRAAPDSATSGPRRLDRTSSAPAPTSAPPYAARRSAPDPAPPAPPAEPAVADRTPDTGAAVLPQRVPAEPDVPVVPEPPAVEPPAETPELARIATHLRRDDEPAPLRERPEGFDVNAILDAVREVAGVRDAALRRTLSPEASFVSGEARKAMVEAISAGSALRPCRPVDRLRRLS
ncbi:hypothetical protein AB0I41_18060, partial [Micromonospora sp. NPDC050200]